VWLFDGFDPEALLTPFDPRTSFEIADAKQSESEWIANDHDLEPDEVSKTVLFYRSMTEEDTLLAAAVAAVATREPDYLRRTRSYAQSSFKRYCRIEEIQQTYPRQGKIMHDSVALNYYGLDADVFLSESRLPKHKAKLPTQMVAVAHQNKREAGHYKADSEDGEHYRHPGQEFRRQRTVMPSRRRGRKVALPTAEKVQIATRALSGITASFGW
jgi:hypothetical protein